MELKWAFLLFVGAVLSLCGCLNWMAGGSFTQEEFAILRGKVDAFDTSSSLSTYTPNAAKISDELNLLWAPAWNVVIIPYSSNQNYDAVLYGYGFNGRWFWQNGFLLTDGTYISIIIWKDYNCI